MPSLSEHFSTEEFADKSTGECKINPKLIEALEALRNLAGKPIHINSGYRTPSTNAAVGGVRNSQHELGNAADIEIEGLDTFKLCILADQIPAFQNGGIGIYPGHNFVHVDVRDTRARWARVNGKYGHIEEAFA